MRILIIPLLILAAMAVLVSASGVQAWWAGQSTTPLHPALPVAAAAALHIGWLICAAHRRAALVVVAGFYASLRFAERGFATLRPGEPYFAGALLLEVLPLLLALAVNERRSWAQRLGDWRRARGDIALQLQMGDGVVPWFRKALAQWIGGAADVPVSKTFRRLAIELADVESRLGVRVAAMAAPEQIRQYVAAGAAQLLSYAEQSSDALAIDLEQHTLALAAACREQCESLPGVSSEEKRRLAQQCEHLLFEIIRPAGATRALTVQTLGGAA